MDFYYLVDFQMTQNKEKNKKPNPKDIYFSLAELEPVLRDWASRLIGSSRKSGRKGSPIMTNFPDIGATDFDGKPTSLEHLLADMGVVPSVIVPLTKPNYDSLKVKLNIAKPYWIPLFFWNRLGIGNVIAKFVSAYCNVKLIDEKNGVEIIGRNKEIIR